MDKYRCYAASRLAKARGQSEEILRRTIFDGGESHAASVEQQRITKKSCSSRCVLGWKDTEDEPLCVITPEESGWYRAYVRNFLLEDPDSFMAKKFWLRFCLPYPSYKDLLHQITSDNRFERWCVRKWNGKKSSPVQLLLLGTLRYLGRGWTFDDIKEQTAISECVHCKFFHKFIEFGSTTLYSMHVISPVHLAEAQSNMAESTLRQDFLVESGHPIVLTS